MPQLRFPLIDRVEFRQFSLYSNRPSQIVPVKAGVFCLAGGNGLGKSTFLNAVGYALTGVVPNPDDTFQSIDEHYSDNLSYASSYFRGRIDDGDQEGAEVSIAFHLGDHRYALTRSLFERESLRSLEIVDGRRRSLVPKSAISDADRSITYRRQVTADMGVGSFEEYVFLQHFVLTFDERRRLLFWDSDLMERALYVAFGIDAEDARKADKLRREVERANSQRGQAQYQATEARGRLRELQAAVDSDDDENPATGADYRRLRARSHEAEAAVQRSGAELEDARLALTRLRAEELSLRTAYEREFAARFDELADPATHPAVATTIEDAHCAICGTASARVADTVQAALDSGHCPLCRSDIGEQPVPRGGNSALAQTRRLSKRLTEAARAIRARERVVKLLEAEFEAANAVLAESRRAVVEFEAENDISLQLIALAGSGLEQAEQHLRAEIDRALERKEEWRVKRDAYRDRLRNVQGRLAEGYRAAEVQFVPLFTDLAQDFLGLELELQLDVRQSTKVELVLTVEGTRRRALEQLSESQRYFVDIALRMALAQHMSAGGPATLFIDTPEGSLDLAYESRAGQLFADFVGRRNNLLMTANLNASQLLRQLAMRCGHARMELVRMIDWRELSDVQAEAEGLFDEAYFDIERALRTASRRT